MAGPDVDFWEQRFARGDTPWDRGAPGPQLQKWIDDGVIAAGQRVLVPGCGAGHDVVALAQARFDVTGVDYAAGALDLARAALRRAGDEAMRCTQLVEADVTTWQPAQHFDVVYEQTCWCALHPDHWAAYAAQLARWLAPGGRLLLLAMQAPRPGAAEGRVEGPPYHLDIHAVRALLPGRDWDWPAPPYARVPHPVGIGELAIALRRR